jgi:hypothetical protein
MFRLGVAYVSHLCCKCFIWVLHMFHTYIASVSSGRCICFQHIFLDICYKCLNCFWTYDANVSSRCCKSRSGVVYGVVDPICSSRAATAAGPSCMCVGVEGVWKTVRAQIETKPAWGTERRRSPREAGV